MNEQQNSSMLSVAMNYAIPLGLFWIFKYLFVIGGEYTELSKYINSVLSIGTPIITYILLLRYRDTNKEGRILYGEAILFTLLIFGLASLIECVITSVHLFLLNPDLVDQMNQQIYDLFSKMTLPDLYMNQLDTIFSYGALYYVTTYIIQNMMIGFFLALILGYVASRPKK